MVVRQQTFFNVVVRRLLASGIPIGPDVLLTVRGRTSGAPRSNPVVIFEHEGRRGLVSLFGESHGCATCEWPGERGSRSGPDLPPSILETQLL